MQACGLVEVPHEYVFVVSYCDYGLKNEDAGTHNRDGACFGVGVLPANAVVDFVHAHGIGFGDWGAGGVRDDEGEILRRCQCVVCGKMREEGSTLITPRQSQPRARLLAATPAPISPTSKTLFRE